METYYMGWWSSQCLVLLAKIRPIRYGNRMTIKMETLSGLAKIRPIRYGNIVNYIYAPAPTKIK